MFGHLFLVSLLVLTFLYTDQIMHGVLMELGIPHDGVQESCRLV